MAKTTVTVGEFILNVLSAEQYAAAAKAGEIDPNQMYLTPEKQLVVAVSEDEYEAMKAAGTLDYDVLYVTPVTEQTTIAEATETTAGLMPPASMKKLNGIDEGANKYTHPTHTARSIGLYKITVDSLGHVTAVSAVQKSDITGLGIPSSDTTYSLASAYNNGLMSPAQYSKLSGIESEANKPRSMPRCPAAALTRCRTKSSTLPCLGSITPPFMWTAGRPPPRMSKPRALPTSRPCTPRRRSRSRRP